MMEEGGALVIPSNPHKFPPPPPILLTVVPQWANLGVAGGRGRPPRVFTLGTGSREGGGGGGGWEQKSKGAGCPPHTLPLHHHSPHSIARPPLSP